MKRLSNLLAALVFASLVIFMSCGGGGGSDTPPDVRIEIADNMVSGSWSGATVTTDNGEADGIWTNFSIDFRGDQSGGQYTVSGVPDGFEDVWANGTWEFTNNEGTQISRTQNSVTTPIAITVSETALSLEFQVTESGRAGNITGLWRFEF